MLTGGLPVAIVVFLQLSLEMLMKGTEISLDALIRRVVGFSGHETLQLFDVVERIFGGVLPNLWQRLHWS